MYFCHSINTERRIYLPECFCIFSNIIERNAELKFSCIGKQYSISSIKVTQVEQHVKCNTNEGFDLDYLRRKATKEGNISQKRINFCIPRTYFVFVKFDITNKG